jgi:hypothetical protein
MTRATNARLAGFTFLFYIVIGITGLVVSSRTTSGAEGTAAKLASIAQHTSLVSVNILLTLLQAACALVLAVTLYALTRDEDPDLAVMAMCCRVGEGVVGVLAPLQTLALMSVATASTAADALGAVLLNIGTWTGIIAATCFAVGSLLFSYLFLRARSIPVPLAWVGVLASVLLVVALPLQLAGLLSGPVTSFMWIPMLAFEVPLAVWLLVKGAAMPARAGFDLPL